MDEIYEQGYAIGKELKGKRHIVERLMRLMDARARNYDVMKIKVFEVASAVKKPLPLFFGYLGADDKDYSKELIYFEMGLLNGSVEE